VRARKGTPPYSAAASSERGRWKKAGLQAWMESVLEGLKEEGLEMGDIGIFCGCGGGGREGKHSRCQAWNKEND